MRLNLILNGICIASAAIDPARCRDEFYLQAIRRSLVLQNQDVLELIPAQPVYAIEVSPSAALSLFGEKEKRVIMINNQETLGREVYGWLSGKSAGWKSSFSYN